MRILVTGIAGFLGSNLAHALITMGHDVVGCDNLIGGYSDNVPNMANVAYIDCNEFDSMRRLMGGVDVVYHCAAEAYEGLSVCSPHRIVRSVVAMTASVLSAAASSKVKRFVYLSSMARYGAGKVPFHETTSVPKPQDPYGISKLAAEALVRNICDVHGIEWLIAVPHNIYGPYQRYTDPYRNVAAIFVNQMLQGKQPIIYGTGHQRRCFSYVSDCVGPLLKMIEADSGLVVNIGPDDEFITILELAERIAGILSFRLDPVFVSRRPQEVQDANCSADLARAVLGYSPKVSLDLGLRLLVDWIRSRGPKPFEYHLPIEIMSERTPGTWAHKLY